MRSGLLSGLHKHHLEFSVRCPDNPPMKFTPPLMPGTLIARYKRFLADIDLAGETITAHCANPGSMTGLKDPGMKVWVSEAGNPKRKLKHDFQMVEIGSALIGVNTALPNRLVEEALNAGKITPLAGYDSLRREVKYGQNSRIDFRLQSTGLPDCWVEVKSVTLSRQPGLAEFPDSVTVRGTKHLGELTQIANAGERAVMLFLMQRNDCERFALAADIDPNYAAAFETARKAGVEILVYACAMSPSEITVDHRITF